jgi:GNAT superfamily N-acetyltransferase
VEKGEPVLDAARRELREESSIDVSSSELVLYKVFLSKLTVAYVYLVDKDVRVQLNQENVEYEWYPLEKIEKLDLHYPTYLIVGELKRNGLSNIKEFHPLLEYVENIQPIQKGLIKNTPGVKESREEIRHRRPREFHKDRPYVTYSEKTIKNGSVVMIHAHVDDAEIGHVGICRHNRRLCNLIVHPEHRGNGYSNLLMEKALAHELNPVELRADPDRGGGLDLDGLTRFYQKFGFELVPNSIPANLMRRCIQ